LPTSPSIVVVVAIYSSHLPPKPNCRWNATFAAAISLPIPECRRYLLVVLSNQIFPASSNTTNTLPVDEIKGEERK
jgi:hypothetical protein